MAFSKTERVSRKLDGIEPKITRWHRWAVKDIIPFSEVMDRLEYAVTKQIIQGKDRDLCQGKERISIPFSRSDNH